VYCSESPYVVTLIARGLCSPREEPVERQVSRITDKEEVSLPYSWEEWVLLRAVKLSGAADALSVIWR
jgi:hypothetical protein